MLATDRHTDIQTGYPSIDKPWEKYYRKKVIRDFNVNQKLCSMIWEVNKNNLNKPAIDYMGIAGNTYSYKEIFEMSRRLASSYVKAGVKAGDTVLIATVSGPEEALNLLALNQLGAISKWIDITIDVDDLKESILEDDVKIMVCFATLIPELEKILEDTCCEKVLYVDPGQFIKKRCFMSGHGALQDLKQLKAKSKEHELPLMPKKKQYSRFIDFIYEGSKDYFDCAEYCKETPMLKIQSSGTTGKPKVIVHTDYSVNQSIAQNAGVDLPFYSGNVLLKLAPSWVAYGLVTSMAMPLAFSMTVLCEPGIESDLLVRMNDKYDMVVGVPFLYRYLAEHIDEVGDMSRHTAFVSGGDKISKNEIISIQELIKSKGCNAPIVNGAGCNEVCGPGCVNPVLANRPGSIGIPEYGNIIGIFDTETLEEKPYNEKGEICYKSEAAFLCYYNNPEKTEEIKVKHPDGNVWVHTRDIGYIDEDGYVYIEGRITRVIIVGGFKISANMIEEALDDCKLVKECVAVAVPDKEMGEVPMLFSVLAEGIDESEADTVIRDICKNKIKGRAIPKYYAYLDSLPYTSNKKYDYRKLEAIGAEIVK